MSEHQPAHETWSSRTAFLLSAIGFAVGLGNIWRFPYVAGENGGGAFVLIYLAVIFAMGAPLVAAELMIGRRGRMSPIVSMRKVAAEAGASAAWGVVGLIALIATFAILTFYAVIAGWAMDYLFRAIFGGFRGLSAEQSRAMFDALLASPWRLAFWQGAVLALTAFITSRGVTRGIERAALALMPMLFAILILLAIYGATTEGFSQAATFLFAPKFEDVTAMTFLAAIGQAFFSVGVAMGGMMTYGAYLPRTIKPSTSSIIIVSADTLVALVAGLAIFPIVFANGLEPTEGAGLVFQTLPLAFGAMPFGGVFAVLFFLLLTAAALTSTVANFEPLLSWAEERRGISRRRAAIVFGALIFAVGSGSVLSFNLLKDVHPLGFIALFEGMTIYDATDFIASNVLLPLGGFFTAIFAGWVVTRRMALEELELPDGVVFRLWRLLIRYVAPIAIAALLAFAFL
ncbi:MAG: sodium-dependent transporter [Amphiplicatus sp.]